MQTRTNTHIQFTLNQATFLELLQGGPGFPKRTFGGQLEQILLHFVPFCSQCHLKALGGTLSPD